MAFAEPMKLIHWLSEQIWNLCGVTEQAYQIKMLGLLQEKALSCILLHKRMSQFIVEKLGEDLQSRLKEEYFFQLQLYQ